MRGGSGRLERGDGDGDTVHRVSLVVETAVSYRGSEMSRWRYDTRFRPIPP